MSYSNLPLSKLGKVKKKKKKHGENWKGMELQEEQEVDLERATGPGDCSTLAQSNPHSHQILLRCQWDYADLMKQTEML